MIRMEQVKRRKERMKLKRFRINNFREYSFKKEKLNAK
jgi:hypothetical protein